MVIEIWVKAIEAVWTHIKHTTLLSPSCNYTEMLVNDIIISNKLT